MSPRTEALLNVGDAADNLVRKYLLEESRTDFTPADVTRLSRLYRGARGGAMPARTVEELRRLADAIQAERAVRRVFETRVPDEYPTMTIDPLTATRSNVRSFGDDQQTMQAFIDRRRHESGRERGFADTSRYSALKTGHRYDKDMMQSHRAWSAIQKAAAIQAEALTRLLYGGV